MTKEQFACVVDVSLLKTGSTLEDTLKMTEFARKNHLHSVDGVAVFYPEIISALQNSDVLVGSACGFIMISSRLKAEFARQNIEMGCNECEMTINMPAFKSGFDDAVVREICMIKQAIGNNILKCIIETPMLSDEEIRHACELVVSGGADYVKTSGGQEGDTTLHHVEVIADALQGKIDFIAAGGIRDLTTAQQMLDMGAARLGVDYFSAVEMFERV